MLKFIKLSHILSHRYNPCNAYNASVYNARFIRRDLSTKKTNNNKIIKLAHIRDYFEQSDKEEPDNDYYIDNYNNYNYTNYKQNNSTIDLKSFSPEKMEYIKNLRNDERPIVICTGPTGSGKTYLACLEALHSLHRGTIQKILLTRPAVSIENEQHGFLPGNLESKMDPWLKPIYDNFEDISTPKKLAYLIKNKTIEVCPLAYIRGRTFKNTFIIADEMQNSSPMQFKTLLTRIGDNTKIILTGDFNQSDINDVHKNDGLNDFLHKLRMYSHINDTKFISYINLTNADVIRHPSVIEVLEIYESII
jgi:phosphate starvation-inducible PhoH-like protein